MGVLDRGKSLLLRELIDFLPQLQPCAFQGGGIVSPIGPAPRNWLDDGVYEGGLPEVFEYLDVFIVLNAVADVLQPYPRCRFRGPNGRLWIEHHSIRRARNSTGRRIKVVP